MPGTLLVILPATLRDRHHHSYFIEEAAGEETCLGISRSHNTEQWQSHNFNPDLANPGPRLYPVPPSCPTKGSRHDSDLPLNLNPNSTTSTISPHHPPKLRGGKGVGENEPIQIKQGR